MPTTPARRSPSRPCPVCRLPYDPDVRFCVPCGVEIETGIPLALIEKAQKQSAPSETPPEVSAEAQTVNFGQLTLLTALKPESAAALFPGCLFRPAILFPILALYLFSLGAVALPYAFPAREEQEAAAAEEDDGGWEGEAAPWADWKRIRRYPDGTKLKKSIDVKFAAPLGEVKPGESFDVKVHLRWHKTGEPVKGAVWLQAVGEEEEFREIDVKKDVRAVAGAAAGEYEGRLTAAEEGTTVLFVACFEDEKAEPQFNASDAILRCPLEAPAEEAAAEESGGPPVSWGTLMIVTDVASLLLSMFFFSAMARLMATSWSLGLVAVALLYVAGLTNFLSLLKFVVPDDFDGWVDRVQACAAWWLSVRSLQGIYGLDQKAAMTLAGAAGLAKLFLIGAGVVAFLALVL